MSAQYWVRYASGQVSEQPVPHDAVVQMLQSNAGVVAVCSVGAQEWIPASNFLPPGTGPTGKPAVVDKIGPTDVVKAVVLGFLCGIGAIAAGVIALVRGRVKEGLLYLGCGFACSLIVGAVFLSRPSRGSVGTTSTTDSGSSRSASRPTEQVVEVTDIAKFVKDYSDNELASDNSYKGKLVKVTGTVETVSKDILDKPYVILGSGAALEVVSVQCSLDDRSVQAAAALKKGQRSTVIGRVSGRMMNVQMVDCVIQ